MRRRWLAAGVALGVIAPACAFDFAGYDPRETAPPACAPGETVACYEGPDGTREVGRCRAGVATCVDGAFGPCEGAIEPEPERCDTVEDDDCDGSPLGGEAGCLCLPSRESVCYEGPAGTLDVGICRAGTGECDATGTGLVGACLGQVLPVGESCESALDEDCDGVANDWCASWHRRYTTASSQRAFALDLHPGLIALGGEFGREGTSGSLTFDLDGPALTSAGLMDMYVGVIADDDASHLWSRSFGGPDFDAILGVAFDEAGDLYAVGTFVGPMSLDGVPLPTGAGDRDALLLKLDGATGDTLWSRVFTGAGDAEATSVAVGGGMVVVGGSFDTAITFDATPVAANAGVDGFVVALDAASGAHLWDQVIGDLDGDAVRSVHLAPTGDVLVGGEWDEPLTLGAVTFPDAYGQGAFVMVLASDGTPQWGKTFDGAGDDWVSRARYGADGRIYVAGAGEDGIDFGAGPISTLERDAFVGCFESDGELAWADVIAVEGLQQANAVDGDADGRAIAGIALRNHLVIDGLLYPGSLDDSWLMVQYDAGGAISVVRMFGDHNDQDLHHARFLGAGAILAGDCRGQIGFGDAPPTETGAETICLARLAP